jgi:uncharacterized protein YgbK (DUF1537 family)
MDRSCVGVVNFYLQCNHDGVTWRDYSYRGFNQFGFGKQNPDEVKNNYGEVVKIGVIADDLSGALDTGAQFAKLGLETRLNIIAEYENNSQVAVINTDSREKEKDLAIASVKQAAAILRSRLLYKKIDSTLRGHFSSEILVLINATSYQKAAICPTVVDEGRWVKDGKLWIHNLLLHETEFAHDPTWPARTSSIQERLGVPADHIPLSIVRSGEEDLRRRIRDVKSIYLIPDAITDSDLDNLAQAVIDTDVLPCGALGFAHAWGAAIAGIPPSPQKHELILEDPILIVAGSHHPITRSQIRELVRAHNLMMMEVHPVKSRNDRALLGTLVNEISENKSILLCAPETPIPPGAARKRIMVELSELTGKIIASTQIGALVLCGGETAQSVLSRLEVKAIDIQGEIKAGFPCGILIGGIGNGLPILSKAGGFGDRETLKVLYDQLMAHR